MFQKYSVKFSIIFLVALFISACSASKEVTKSKEFLEAGMFDQAIILLKQEVQTNPKNAEAHLLLGVAYLGSGTTSLAEQELNTAIVMDSSLKSEASKRCYDIAKILAKTDKSKANAALMKAKEYDPSLEKDEQFFFLANIDTEQSDTARMEAAKRYLTLFPAGANIAQATYELAEGLMSSDKKQAKIYFTQVVSQFPGTEWAKQSSERLANWTETKDISVSSQQMWIDTGVTLTKGQKFDIQASGQWSFGSCCPAVDANGAPNRSDPMILMLSAAVAVLLGKIGNETFVVGESYSGSSPTSGKLFLSMNDIAGEFSNNSGALSVHISYSSKSWLQN